MPNVSFSELQEYEELLSQLNHLQSVEAGLVADLAASTSVHEHELANQLTQAIQHERSKRQLDENAGNIAIAQAEELTLGVDAFQLASDAISSFVSSDMYSKFVYSVVVKMGAKSDLIEICVSNSLSLDLKEFNAKVKHVEDIDLVIIKTEDAEINLSKYHLIKNISPKLVQFILQ